MYCQFTPGAQRALAAAAGWSNCADCAEIAAPAVLLGLLTESECRAAIMLKSKHVDAAAVLRRWPELTRREPSDGGTEPPPPMFSDELELALQAACGQFGEHPRPEELATEHLLLGLVAAGSDVSEWLRGQGFDADELAAQIDRIHGRRPKQAPDALPLPDLSDGHLPEGERRVGTLRAVDAAANRAREGIRTVEDYVRFVLDDRHLTDQCKQLRHELAAALRPISSEHRLAARETQADVGTTLATESEQRRDRPADVSMANFTRLQEALRSLGEFGKLLDPGMAGELEQLRYRSYTLQRAVEITRTSIERLDGARLYVLIDGQESPEDLERLAGLLIEAGVDVIQLRDTRLDDRRLLDRARFLRDVTAEGDTLFVMNDRADLAALSRADGVHIGQEELSVKDARTIVGPELLIGVSTHSLDQARQAVLDGANYIGVGPTFPSGTKHFDEFPGLDLLRDVSAEIRLPAFAIGGITQENLPEVLGAGVTRVAVGGAIAGAGDPGDAARKLLSALG